MAAHSGRRRSLVGYSPWDRKESDTTERLHFSLIEKKKQNTLLEFSLMIKLHSIWKLSTYALLKEFRTGTSKYAALVDWLF